MFILQAPKSPVCSLLPVLPAAALSVVSAFQIVMQEEQFGAHKSQGQM